MTKYDDTNRGVLFKADKEGNDKRPDYTGKINVEGIDYALSAWLREGKSGKFLSLAVSAKQMKALPKTTHELDDDQVPF